MQATQVATIRKHAPEFEAMSWWNGFKKVRLSDYKGKSHSLFLFSINQY